MTESGVDTKQEADTAVSVSFLHDVKFVDFPIVLPDNKDSF